MKKTHQKLSIVLLWIAILWWGISSFFVRRNNVQAQEKPLDAAVWLDRLYNSLTPKHQSKKWLIMWFCNAAKTNKNGFTDGGRVYTPTQSIFVWILCKGVGIDEIFFNDSLIRERSAFMHIPQGCDTDWEMYNCDFSKILPKIFTAVMNDHSTLAMAWWALTNSEVDVVIDNFSQTYFTSGSFSSICNPWKEYIGNKWATDEKQALCSHPQTYQQLKGIIEQLKKQRANIVTIDPDKKLTTILEQDVCKTQEARTNNMFICWYSSKNTAPNNNLQYNLRYNELLYYKLFITWISEQLSNDPEKFKPIRLNQTNTNNETDNTTIELQYLQREVMLSENAIVTMSKTIDNFRATLPLHIGLVAYQEDVLTLRKSLVKIYTPIQQLYYKLRNVQQKN